MLSKIQNKGIKLITVINKMDKIEKLIFDTILDELNKIDVKNLIQMSVAKNEGVETLKKEIEKMFLNSDFDYEQELVITNARHKDLLRKSIDYLKLAKNEIDLNNPIDIISIYIKKATSTLGEIIGTDVNIDVANKIFEKFCLGK